MSLHKTNWLFSALLLASCAETPPAPPPAPVTPPAPASTPLPEQDERIRRALEVYAKFPPPEWGEHVAKRVADNYLHTNRITPAEREFLDQENYELWELGRRTVEKRSVPGLIEQLRSEKIGDRDAAARKLKAIGAPALPDLETAARDADAEFAGRAKAVLTAIHSAERPPLKPEAPEMKKQAPELYKVRVTTSQGDFTITVHRPWAPHGADRFYNLVRGGFYDEARFFRVLKGFVCQFGMHADPAVSALWKDATIPDDPVSQTNTRGRVTFATAGPNTRTTQLFINFNDKNARLDAMGFSPFGEVTEGMDIVDKLYADYGEGEPRGSGPSQDRISGEGNAYLKSGFPKLDYIRKAALEDR